MKPFFRVLIRIVLVIAGFLFIFNLPSLLGIGKNHVVFNYKTLWINVKSDFQLLVDVKDIHYLEFFKELDIAESYQYTMTILVASLILIIFLATVIAVLIILSPEKVRNRLKSGVNFFEAVPDLLVIFLFQFFVITLYSSTGLKFLQLYGLFGHKPYFVPIMTVSFLPFFLMLQFLIKVINEEQTQQYVLYAKAKGIGRIRTLLVHIMRNIVPLLLMQLRTIVWVLLSNIYLVEFLFNINGFNQQFLKIIFMGGDFASLVLSLLMLSIPLLVMEAAGWLISRVIKGREPISI
ncbi:ABC transporter permease subunit [Bacillus sp. sid0103]|uniref:ABC transporter permease subunit n=1 Tax=Bacillus sp. sid0103 TaxID=2856337 RepID=UPI001C487222|nr:ABC transporter permease subunit [Bacillus sp. sid0103]MBV7504736.1 ABC transporter permease subunit [Bacillus sp. sid0103]